MASKGPSDKSQLEQKPEEVKNVIPSRENDKCRSPKVDECDRI